MKLFIDYNNNDVFIMAPKCGTTTIANYLNISMHIKYDQSEINRVLSDSNYRKLILYKSNIVDRFLSGFTEDLLNNNCYNDMDISFSTYLQFLHHCYQNKIPNVTNLNVFLKKDYPVYFGQCSNNMIAITNDNGIFQSHIQTQKFALQCYVDIIQQSEVENKNCFIIEMNNLNSFINEGFIKNNKTQSNYCTETKPLCIIKQMREKINHQLISDENRKIINDICSEDLDFIKELEYNFNAV